MSSENVQPLLSSYALSSRFANGPRETDNRLQPPIYQRIATLSVSQQREEKCPTTLDWGTKSWSYLLPQSLQVISSSRSLSCFTEPGSVVFISHVTGGNIRGGEFVVAF